MTASSHWRGHPIYYDGQCWRYKDTGEKTLGNERPCAACSLVRTPEGHDGCLGTLPGVSNACCGHGQPNEAYLQLSDGSDIRGFDALDMIDKMIEKRDKESSHEGI